MSISRNNFKNVIYVTLFKWLKIFLKFKKNIEVKKNVGAAERKPETICAATFPTQSFKSGQRTLSFCGSNREISSCTYNIFAAPRKNFKFQNI